MPERDPVGIPRSGPAHRKGPKGAHLPPLAGNCPRRSARMTHFCSLRLTHTKNTICRRARGEPSDIIHAEGVRGDFLSSAPKARNGLRLQEETACAGETIDRQGRQGQPAQHLPYGKNALLPGGKTPPNGPWWWVTFSEQSRVISRECRSPDLPLRDQPGGRRLLAGDLLLRHES